MVTLASINGASLVPDLGNVRNDILRSQQQARQEKEQSDLATQLSIALGGDAPAAPVQEESPSVGILGEIAPQIGQFINKIRQSGDAASATAFRQEAQKGVDLAKEISALPSHADKLRRLRQEAGEIASSGGDVSRLANLANMSESRLALELEKMQLIGNESLKQIPDPLSFLSDDARRDAFTKVLASNPQTGNALLAARDRGIARRQAAEEGALGRDFQERRFAASQADSEADRALRSRGLDIQERALAQRQSQGAGPLSPIGKLISDEQNVIDRFGAGSPQAAAIREAIQGEGEEPPKLSDVAGIRKEFTKLSGDFITLRDAIGKVRSAASNPSAAGDLSLVFNYMKILDPGSTVREGEFATAQNAAGVPDIVMNAYNRALTGERLNPAQRSDFVGTANRMFSSQLTQQRDLENQFRGISERANIDPTDVVVDFVGTEESPQRRRFNPSTGALE